MTDRTSQPSTQVGVNPIYPASFLWNAAVPNVNSLDGTASTSGLKGTDNTGTAGKYRKFNTMEGAMSFAATLPTNAYTLVIVMCYPDASVSNAKLVSTPNANGMRIEASTTGGGSYAALFHTGAAASVHTYSESVTTFSSNPCIHIAAYSGGLLRQYRKNAAGVVSNFSGESIGYVAPTGGAIELGDKTPATAQALYAVMVVPSDVGDAECLALQSNPWRMFEPIVSATVNLSGANSTGSATSSTGAISVTAPAVNLTGANSTGSATSSTGAITVTPLTGTLTTDPFCAWGSPSPLAVATIPNVTVTRVSDRVQILSLANQVTNSSGQLVLVSGSLVSGVAYMVATWNADGSAHGLDVYTAS